MNVYIFFYWYSSRQMRARGFCIVLVENSGGLTWNLSLSLSLSVYLSAQRAISGDLCCSSDARTLNEESMTSWLHSPMLTSFTVTLLRYQLGEGPALLCHNWILNTSPRLSGNLQRSESFRILFLGNSGSQVANYTSTPPIVSEIEDLRTRRFKTVAELSGPIGKCNVGEWLTWQ